MPVWWRELQAVRAESAGSGALRIDPTADVSPEATLNADRGPIVFGPGTKVCAGAYVEGPVTIGADCLVGNLALIRGTTAIGDGVRIGFATEIKNAIIESGVTIGPQCFVADSKIERGAYLGAQVRTSNHRLDKRTVEVIVDGKRHDTGLEKLGCRIGEGAALGIQVIVLPGREIAPGSIFAPKIVIEKNLPRGRYRTAQLIETF
jgi:bifunctional UDP-N-acetylglucosamine pyrophosphorylase/glucosamine-1-phosphate N-acetyltransferase